jgi:hypothetical protein
MSNLLTILHQVNVLKDRLEAMSEGDLTQGRIQLLLDNLEMVEMVIDRRKVKREVKHES